MSRTLIMSVEPVPDLESPALRRVQIHHRLLEAGSDPLSAEAAAAALSTADIAFGDMDFRDTNQLVDAAQYFRVGTSNLADELRFEGASMWQFLPSFIWPDVFHAAELTKCLRRIVKESRPEAIVALPSRDRFSDVWHRLGATISAQAGIDYFSPTHRLNRVRPAWIPGPRQVRATLADNRATRQAAKLGAADPHRNGKHLLFATMARHWVPDPSNPKGYFDEQLGPLLGALKDGGWGSVTAVDCPYNGPPDTALLRERQAASSAMVAWRSFAGAGSPTLARRAAFSRLCKRWWKTIYDDSDLIEGLIFQGVQLFPVLQDILRVAFIRTLIGCLTYRDQARRMLIEEEPDAVAASYETGPYARAMLIEAELAGIPTVALQHGMIFGNHYDYMHSDVGTDPRGSTFTVARTTCVWGSLWKNSLTEDGNYPPEAVSVTGNWRHDAMKQPSGRAGREALALSADEPDLILVCSAALDTPKLVDAVYAAVTPIEGSAIRIRPHPSENLARIRSAAVDAGGLARHVSRTGSLLDVLAAATVVVSQLSTVVSEALLADRPVILADFERQEGWSIYKESAACLVVSSPEELKNAIARVISDSKLRGEMAAGREALLELLFGPRDGRAGERVVAALTS